MSDRDPTTALALAPGERVLWQGGGGLSPRWVEVRSILRAGSRVWLVAVGLTSAVLVSLALLDPSPVLLSHVAGIVALSMAMWTALLAPGLTALALSRIVGPYVISLMVIAFALPPFGFAWLAVVWRHGWIAAIERTPPSVYVAAALIVGAPASRIAIGVWRRLSVAYVLTNQRGAAIRFGLTGAHVEWTAPLMRGGKLQARSVRLSGVDDRGHIVFGTGAERREMSMVRDPERAIDDVRAALAS
jgi:hypothetical protein